MQKKGQLTLFLVLGIFLIILLSIFLQNNSKDFSDNSEKGLNSLNQYLQLCFNDRFEDVLKYNALQGGFFNINTSSSNNEFLIENKIRNYLTNKNQLIPNKKTNRI